MKNIEITTRVFNNLDEIDKILCSQGFKYIRKRRAEDQYMAPKDVVVTKDNILESLSKCVLIRYVGENDKPVYQNLTYKKKEYDGDTVLTEEKIILDVKDLKKARRLLEVLDFYKLVDVSYDLYVYGKDDIELCFQQVEGLGLLLEYENNNDYTDVSSKNIIKEKKKMLKEIKKLGLNISDDFDIKKAYQLISDRM